MPEQQPFCPACPRSGHGFRTRSSDGRDREECAILAAEGTRFSGDGERQPELAAHIHGVALQLERVATPWWVPRGRR
jgi:hypothetical protein